MTQFEIAIFETDELHEHCKSEFGRYSAYEAAKRARDFVEGAFDRSSQHSVDVSVSYSTPDAPIENPGCMKDDYFHAYHPCDDCECHYPSQYPNLHTWFQDWLEGSCGPYTVARDVNILLTDQNGGGCGAGGRTPPVATAGGAFTIAKEFDDYQTHSTDDVMWDIDTLLEEIGHTLIMNDNGPDMIDDDDDGKDHDSGTIYERTTRYGTHYYTMTPMGITGNTSYNNCGWWVDKSRWDPGSETAPEDGFEGRYSGCTEDYFGTQ